MRVVKIDIECVFLKRCILRYWFNDWNFGRLFKCRKKFIKCMFILDIVKIW